MLDRAEERKTLRERIENGERGGSDADREALLEADKAIALIPSEIGDHRAVKILRHSTIMSEKVGPIAEAVGPAEDPETGEKTPEKEKAEEIVRWIHETHDNAYTNADYRAAIRAFGRHSTGGDDVPPSLDWIPTGTPNTHDPTPDPDELLSVEEVEAMVDACMNNRDKALIWVAFEAGVEPGSLHELTLDEILDGDVGYKLKLNGRHGKHHPTLIDSRPYVDRWLADHPTPDDPSAPVWTRLHEAERLSYTGFLKPFKAAAKRAGVTKEATPRNFRRSNAAWLARQGVSDRIINDRQGRASASSAIRHYVARFGPDNAERAYARSRGIDIEDDREVRDRRPVECPRCDRDCPPVDDFCWDCGQALNHKAASRVGEDKREVRQRFLKLAKEKPDLLDEVETATQLMELVQSEPRLLEDAQEFRDALGES